MSFLVMGLGFSGLGGFGDFSPFAIATRPAARPAAARSAGRSTGRLVRKKAPLWQPKFVVWAKPSRAAKIFAPIWQTNEAHAVMTGLRSTFIYVYVA